MWATLFCQRSERLRWTTPAHSLCLAVWGTLSRGLLLVEFSHAKPIQRFLPRGHGSVICQTKCFLRLAMCTHQVSVTCKSHFTERQKTSTAIWGEEGRVSPTTSCHRSFGSLTSQRIAAWNQTTQTSETTRRSGSIGQRQQTLYCVSMVIIYDTGVPNSLELRLSNQNETTTTKPGRKLTVKSVVWVDHKHA